MLSYGKHILLLISKITMLVDFLWLLMGLILNKKIIMQKISCVFLYFSYAFMVAEIY